MARINFWVKRESSHLTMGETLSFWYRGACLARRRWTFAELFTLPFVKPENRERGLLDMRAWIDQQVREWGGFAEYLHSVDMEEE